MATSHNNKITMEIDLTTPSEDQMNSSSYKVLCDALNIEHALDNSHMDYECKGQHSAQIEVVNRIFMNLDSDQIENLCETIDRNSKTTMIEQLRQQAEKNLENELSKAGLDGQVVSVKLSKKN